MGRAVWDKGGDIRDAISIGKLVRNNDGPKSKTTIAIVHLGVTRKFEKKRSG
jgi:hypothetical protein